MPRQSGLADREPCPYRIIDDVGGAFCMGCIGGGIWHTVKGAWSAPKGAKLIGSLSAVQARSPILGGQFAVWGGIFACCDCSISSIRNKEDPWNSILSGAITGGVLAVRAGPQAMASSALVGGVLLALIEGMGIMITKWTTPPVPTAEDYRRAIEQQDATLPPQQASLFPGGLFGSSSSGGGGSSTHEELSSPLSPLTADVSGSYMESDGVTTFSTEATSTGDMNNSTSNNTWWPFGSKK